MVYQTWNGILWMNVDSAYYYYNNGVTGLPMYNLTTDAKIYPNPCSEEVNIVLPENNLYLEAIIYDVLSNKIFQKEFSNSVTIKTSELSSGLYFYELRSKNNVLERGKILKQ
jgi:hypothetical protein